MWDEFIPFEITNSTEKNERAAAVKWAAKLHPASLKSGRAAEGPVGQKVLAQAGGALLPDVLQPAKYAMEWATESNLLVCSYVLKDGVDGIKGKELSGKYYAGAAPIVEAQISKAGARLAAWISAIAANQKL